MCGPPPSPPRLNLWKNAIVDTTIEISVISALRVLYGDAIFYDSLRSAIPHAFVNCIPVAAGST